MFSSRLILQNQFHPPTPPIPQCKCATDSKEEKERPKTKRSTLKEKKPKTSLFRLFTYLRNHPSCSVTLFSHWPFGPVVIPFFGMLEVRG